MTRGRRFYDSLSLQFGGVTARVSCRARSNLGFVRANFIAMAFEKR